MFLVSGPGEQQLPWLPDEVTLILRSKDTGGRLIAVRASVRTLTTDDELWEPATQALKASRLNAVDDQVERSAQSCTVRALRPFGAPLEAPGTSPTPRRRAGAALPGDHHRVSPWHLGGRPLRRRGTRLPDDHAGGG